MKPSQNQQLPADIVEDFGRDLLAPPPRKLFCPMIDAHTHALGVEPLRVLLGVAALYGVNRLVLIVSYDEARSYRREFGRSIIPMLRFDATLFEDQEVLLDKSLELLRRAAAEGFCAVKFWFPPKFTVESNVYFDTELLRPIFETMEELGLPALVHVADPDLWFQTHYNDPKQYRTKADHLRTLETVLGRHRSLRIVGAHMAANPEHLDDLDELLEKYPNLFLDSSATKWVSRELSRQGEMARDFILRRADRLIWGTDLVAREELGREHYASRYWVHQLLWEGRGLHNSPIPDGDNTGPLVVSGMDLPDDVLRKLYHRNAERVYMI